MSSTSWKPAPLLRVRSGHVTELLSTVPSVGLIGDLFEHEVGLSIYRSPHSILQDELYFTLRGWPFLCSS